ncbi:MAG: response regulator, partial [Deltaproteobacteria bacterium]|nr:response regulator [Deltaproteobacteria bacterium]
SDQIAEFLFKRSGEPPTLYAKSGAKGRVLVVDDSEFHLKQTATAIKNAGHEVITAKDGFEALKIAVREKLDLIVTDVKMPVMDGWLLLRMIRNRSSLAAIPVIFLTTLSGDEERLLGYKLGVDDFIGKGFTEEELLLRVQRVLERSHAQRGAAKTKALRGDLTNVSLGSLMSLLELEQRTGHLLVIHGEEIAHVFLREGSVISIDLGQEHRDKTPLERFFHILNWTEGQFELSAAEVTGDDTIGLPTSYVLLEHARRKDEENQ